MAMKEAGVVALWLCGHVVFHFHIAIANFYLLGYLLNSVFSDNGILKVNTWIILYFPFAFLKKAQRCKTHTEYNYNMIY